MSAWRDRMVWILSQRLHWPQPEIVYHAFGHDFRNDFTGDNGKRVIELGAYSRCGLLIDHYKSGHTSRRFTQFDEKIAEKFARPCERCYEVVSS